MEQKGIAWLKWTCGLALAAAAAATLAQFGVWQTRLIQTEALTFRGTGVLGLSESLKNWETKQITAGALTFRGTGELGLSATVSNWDTKQVQTEALIFRGTGNLR